MKKIVSYLVILVIGMVFGWLGRDRYFRDTTKMLQSDTLYLWDTVRIEKPAEIKYTKLPEPILIPFTDTIEVHDTIYMVVSKEVREYKDSLYYLRVSGHNPRLDYIEVYPKTAIVKENQNVTRCNTLSVGMEAGYIASPYLPIYLEYSQMLQRNLRIYGKVMYDLPAKGIGAVLGARWEFGW